MWNFSLAMVLIYYRFRVWGPSLTEGQYGLFGTLGVDLTRGKPKHKSRNLLSDRTWKQASWIPLDGANKFTSEET